MYYIITRTNHNTIQTIGIYVRVFWTADHAGQIFIPHRPHQSECTISKGGPHYMGDRLFHDTGSP